MQGALVEAEEPLLDDFLTLDQEVMAEYFWKPAVSYLKLMAHIASNGQGEENSERVLNEKCSGLHRKCCTTAGCIKIPANVTSGLLLELSTLPAATITQEFR